MQRAKNSKTSSPQRPLQMGLLRSFVAVARRLSFSAAAQDLYLTQSAVSRQILAFESEVGVALFQRHTRSVELTQAGKELLKLASTTLDVFDQKIEALRSKVVRKTLSINTWASFASMWLIPKLATFKEENPDIDIQIHTTDAFVAPGENTFDFAIRWAVKRAVPSDAVRLFGERLTPVANPSLMGRRKGLKSARAVLDYTLIDSGAPSNATKSGWVTWRDWLESNELHDLEPKSWLQLSHSDQGILAAQRSQGIALARLPLVLDALTKGELIEVLPGNQTILSQAYWLIASNSSTHTCEQQRFGEWLMAQALVTRLAIGEEP
jgi:DNA-binding transcriptional LysR family regulator